LAAISIDKKEGLMNMKNISRYFFIGMFMILVSDFFPAYSVAKDTGSDLSLLEGTQTTKQYLLQLSGTIMNETFSRSQALLTLTPTSQGEDNPYLIIIEGFPKQDSRNSFFWNSGYSEMSAISNDITCDIKRTLVKGTRMFFMFLSPALLRLPSGVPSTRPQGEVEKDAAKVALPTVIPARAGTLRLRIHSNTISGTVWMKGYDPIEKAFVQYSARIYGKKSIHLKSRDEKKKSSIVEGE
jgi:hypothetical protein